MDIEYKSIFDMQQITKLIESDKFLVARGSDTWYTTKSMTYANLSSDLADVLSNIKFDLKIIDDRSALAGGDKMVASARVTGLIDNDLTLIKNNYISKSEDQVISKSWGFSKIPTCSGDYLANTPRNSLATIEKVGKMISEIDNPVIFCHTFLYQDTANKGFKLVDIIPKQQIPSSITVWISFDNTTKYAKKPTVEVVNSSRVVRIEGTETIQQNHKTNSRANKYYAQVDGLDNEQTLNSTVIRVDNIIANITCTIVIYSGKINFSVEATV